MFKLILALAFVAIAHADNFASYNNESPIPYAYNYAVDDPTSGAKFSAQEEADAGGVVTGSYQVHLPDGRIQTVTYRADSNGYVADVKYDGTPVYPKYNSKQYNPDFAT